jgi:DNA polymerase-1
LKTGNLFDGVSEAIDYDWTPEAPLPLDGIDEIELDFETTGLKWWAGDKPIGVAIRRPDGTAKYYPWGHEGGGNLDEGQMKEFFRREIRNKRITNLNTKFEVHMSRAWGIDLEEQGNVVADVGHYAALLDDHRYKFSLQALAQDYLQDTSQWGATDKTRMKYYHAGQVADGACQDVLRVGALKAIMRPKMTEQGLDKVRELEEDVIFAVAEMEKNAAPLDIEMLRTWEKQTEQDMLKCIYQIYRETGLKVNPDSSTDMDRLFKHLKLPVTAFTDKGRASFTDAVLKKIDHPTIRLVRRAAHLIDLRNKYIVAYSKAVGDDGLLRFNLHQLRTQKDSNDAGGVGTVSGRFSMTDENLQQVMAVEKQVDKYGEDFIIRELFIASMNGQTLEEYRAAQERGQHLFLSADAAQIEYRLFAHYAASPKILAAYKENPTLSFHQTVWELLLPFKPDLLYKPLKNLNFAKIYGAGLIKMAVMMEFITEAEGQQIRAECEASRKKHASHPRLQTAAQVDAVYKQQLPEVQELLDQARNLAEQRGYVKTILGRRSRFPDKQRTHKALNGVIQGSAADVMKLKLVELHKTRKYTGLTMRLTVHDEVCGDTGSEETAKLVNEVLNRQSLDLKVPILWDVNVGRNWASSDIEKLKKKGLFANRAA